MYFSDIKGVKNENALEKEYDIFLNQAEDSQNKTRFLGGVVFQNTFDDYANKPSLNYTLRLNPDESTYLTQYLFFPIELPGPGGLFNGMYIEFI